jgi:predicted aspartyl protease
MMKRTLLVFFLVFLCCGELINVKLSQNQEDPIAVARRRVVAPPGKTELNSHIKVPMVGTKTLPLVEVKLNGKSGYRLLLDTGANVTLLQTRVADELKLPVLRPGDKSKLVALESVQIGGAQFRDLVVGARAWEENIDGVLGFNLFADCLLSLDYQKQQIRVRKGELPETNGKDIFSYRLTNGSPALEFAVDELKLQLMIDTGAAQGIVVSHRTASKLHFVDALSPGPILSTFRTSASRALVGRLRGNIRFGIHEIAEPTIHVRDEETEIIGSGILKDFVLTFDQKNHRVHITV